ncbi:MAG TPA: hypothetical protein VLW65_04245 [Bryobacteraceae bacterium]|nr:hypothetical protein [Bryobacteraceae bacterium]
MPDQPTWLERVPQILASLEEAGSPPFLDRAAVELLFGLKRRQAIELLHAMRGYQVGRTFLVERRTVLDFLRRRSLQGAVVQAVGRKRRVLDHLAAARRDFGARRLRIPVSADSRIRLDGLPAGIELRPGQLTIQFDKPVELLEKLFALSQAVHHDFDRFQSLLETAADTTCHVITPGDPPL